MKKLHLILFFFSMISLGQNAPIELKIDSITTLDSIPEERNFMINYHIENLTNKEVSFFMNPKELIPDSRASLSRKISYKVYENNNYLDIGNLFVDLRSREFDKAFSNAKTAEEKNQLMSKFMNKEFLIDHNDSLKNLSKDNLAFFEKIKSNSLMNTIFTLKPNEKKSFSKKLIWNKKRYIKIDDNEYYIDENTPHFMELSINLMKEEYQNQLEPKDYEKIINNPNFIKGGFTSNKMEINFKE